MNGSSERPSGRRPSGIGTKIGNALIELLKVRSIITIIVIAVMSRMALDKTIDSATFMTIVGAIVAYYFTRKER